MNTSWIFLSLILGVLALVFAVILKRTLHVRYDKRSIRSLLFGLVVSYLIYGFGDIGDSPYADGLTTSQQIAWSLIIVLLSHAVIQYVLWLVWVLFKKYNLIKLPRFVFNLIALIVVIGTILFVLKNVHNLELTGLLVTSTVLSAVIGLAFQDTLGNLISGISLQVESPFQMDDWVNLGGFEGKVVSQNWRTLTLLTRSHHRVSLTNKFIAEDKIVNYSRPTLRQIHNFSITLDYQHPPNFVKKVILDMLEEIEEVRPHATLGAYVQDYMDSGIKYGMKYWMEDYAYVNEVQDIVLSRLWYTLRRHNIKIPYPISELHVDVTEAPSPEFMATQQRTALRAFLGTLAWLGRLKESQLDSLAKASTLEHYGSGDVIIQQGADGDAMFVIRTGIAKVYIATEKDRYAEVADKISGEFMGEMSLLTGETRSATVKAHTDMEIIKIGKESFRLILMEDKELLEEMIEGMKEYKSGLARIIEEEQAKSHTSTASATKIVIQKIKNYLALS